MRVVHVRDPFTLYIGRKFAHFEASKWGNPFHQRRYGFKCLAMYEKYVREGPLWNDLHELDNQTLGCWCHPKGCHGDILKRLREEQLNAIHRTTISD